MVAGEVPGAEPGRFHYCIATRFRRGLRIRQFMNFAAPVGEHLSQTRMHLLGRSYAETI